MYKAKLETISIGDNSMDYVTFGTGDKYLVIIPGLSLQRLKGQTHRIALLYRQFARDYRVLMFDRRNSVATGYSIENMADELYQALEKLGIQYADVLGVSQGGMIAQLLSIKYPDMINRLVLAMTLARHNARSRETIGGWITDAKNNDRASLNKDALVKSFTPDYIRKYRLPIAVWSKLSRKGDLNRFLILAQSILDFDCYSLLGKITCPTLVLGAQEDQVLGVAGAREIAKQIPQAVYYEFENAGHAAYLEVKGFNQQVLAYLQTGSLPS